VKANVDAKNIKNSTKKMRLQETGEPENKMARAAGDHDRSESEGKRDLNIECPTGNLKYRSSGWRLSG
jgi:hypothetical protein